MEHIMVSDLNLNTDAVTHLSGKGKSSVNDRSCFDGF